jgi:hypothetical protein
LLMHAASGSSPFPQQGSLSDHPFFLIHPPLPALSVYPSLLFHSSTWLAGHPLQVTSKLLHVICTSRMYHFHRGDDF